MFKTLHNIDEIEEAHKKNGYVTNKKEINKVNKQMEDLKKPINPKYIFEKIPKNNTNKGKRKPKELNKNKQPPLIQEFGY